MNNQVRDGAGAALTQLAVLPQVSEAIEAARQACTDLRWHPGLRRHAAAAQAETHARAARASAGLEGAELPVDVVRDILRGARPAPRDAVGAVVAGAVRVCAESGAVGEVLRTAPMQALAHLHTLAAAGLAGSADDLGRPRRAGEGPRDPVGPGSAPDGAELVARLDSLAGVLTAPAQVPALVIAAVAHGELMTLRPFVVGNGLVARAVMRAVIVQRGLDPTGVGVAEAACLAMGLPAYATALRGYGSGTPEGVGGWLIYCARLVEDGAAQGKRVADAVLAGRLAG